MRLRITFSVPNGFSIDLNYQHMLTAWIYRCMSKVDPEFVKTWHDTGVKQWKCNGKPYKFFTFSNIWIPSFSIKESTIYALSQIAEITFTTCFDKLAQLFYEGAFHTDFRGMKVSRIDIMPEPVFTNEAIFKTLSPIHVQWDNVHLNPEENEDIYSGCIGRNLSVKYNLWNSTDIFFEYPKIELLSSPKAKTIAFKKGSEKENRNKGYLFKFRITGDPRLIEMGYKAGFGQGNAMGFGCVELINNNHGK